MRVRAVRSVALALAVLIALVALVQGHNAGDSIVYVTKTGAKYHRDGPLVPVESPKATGAPVRSGRCQAATKKGTQCLRKAKAGGAYCWQHG